TLSPFLIEDFRGYAVLALSNSIIYTRVESLLVSMEDQVKERTAQLEEATNQMIQSEKMAMLGVMVAGVAHELNTPSGVILNAAKNLQETVESFVGRPPPEGNFSEIVQLFNYHIQSGNTALPTSAFQLRRQLQKSLEALHIDKSKELASFFVDHNFFSDASEVTEEKLILRLENETLTTKIITMYKSLSIESKTKMLSELEDLAGIHRNAKNILSSASNISRLVKALRIYSRSGSGDFVQANIEESLETTLEILSSIWKHGIEIDRNYNHIPKIECDPDQLNQVWSNLLMNAYHASRSSKRPKIVITTELNNSEIVVRIQDSGTGIPKEIREKIWDPFFTTKEQGEGTGLGLSIVRRIVENHNGIIYFETGKSGTEFFIRLPVKRKERQNKPFRQSEYGRYDWR
ncbi:MAG: HAMP domain-containing histidine kinase, partial [Leptonema sp. (in: Bacteria)]|nr:HAMP domain-containing histidine kinase [Leptonema sp. (in: bacteria)]